MKSSNMVTDFGVDRLNKSVELNESMSIAESAQDAYTSTLKNLDKE